MYYHGGELPGFNSFMGYDPDNDVALVIWTNLTLSPEGKTTAQAMLPTVLDEIYAGLSWCPRRHRRPPGKCVEEFVCAGDRDDGDVVEFRFQTTSGGKAAAR